MHEAAVRAIADRPQHQQVDRRSHSSFNVVFDDSWERLHSLGTSSCNPDVASGTLCEVILARLRLLAAAVAVPYGSGMLLRVCYVRIDATAMYWTKKGLAMLAATVSGRGRAQEEA